jgi:hypothetical protein
MRSRFNVVMMSAASFIVFIAVDSAKSVQTSGHQSPIAVLTDGGGPMCIPDTSCGLADKTGDGPGPMCPPTSGCGNGNITAAKVTQVRAEILLADGPGPMCFPGVGCGYRNDKAKTLWPS